MKLTFTGTALAAILVAITEAMALDASLPAYQAVEGVSGRIKSVGSDTLDNVMALWAKGFEALYPDVKIEIEGKGSATAPPALLQGASQFGPMSRPMKADEVSAFEKKYGYKPARFRVAVDALAVYVNKDNPVPCLTLQQVDQIFSATRQGSGSNSIDTWGGVGMTGEWATKPITIYGRNALSGTFAFFKQTALYNGEYKESVQQLSGSAAVVDAVAQDKFAIGYSGLGYKTAGVRTVPLAAFYGSPCYDTTAEATYSSKYPIARYLCIYLNKNPNEPLDTLRAEFIRYILSKDGQTQTEKGGFFPITNEIREHDLDALGISNTVN
jgi:phosphate transport system substrate-binding protein